MKSTQKGRNIDNNKFRSIFPFPLFCLLLCLNFFQLNLNQLLFILHLTFFFPLLHRSMCFFTAFSIGRRSSNFSTVYTGLLVHSISFTFIPNYTKIWLMYIIIIIITIFDQINEIILSFQCQEYLFVCCI